MTDEERIEETDEDQNEDWESIESHLDDLDEDDMQDERNSW